MVGIGGLAGFVDTLLPLGAMTMQLTIRLSLWFLLIFAARAGAARDSYLVSDQPSGEIWRLQDLNGDGDALDTGEKLLWADALLSVVELEVHGSDVYAIEEGMVDGANQAIRFTDLNGDGDALDIGEQSIWADGFDDPRGIAVDDQGVWYVTENEDDRVWALTDINNDGDALDVGERTLFADQIDGATTVARHRSGILVTGANQNEVFRLNDYNGDGDALDVGESSVITPFVNSPVGVLDDDSGGFYFSSFSNDAVYHAVDRNGDGDMLDEIETLTYADAVFGGINGPWGMTNHADGGFLLASFISGQIMWVRDANGDGDALDQGDVSLFADGFLFPVDVVAVPECSPDADGDGDVDGRDFLIFQRERPEKIPLWSANYGATLPLSTLSEPAAWTTAATSSAVPEPTTIILALAGLCLANRRRL